MKKYFCLVSEDLLGVYCPALSELLSLSLTLILLGEWVSHFKCLYVVFPVLLCSLVFIGCFSSLKCCSFMLICFFTYIWTSTVSPVFMFVFCVLQGISFLEMKHQLLLSYLTNLTFVMLKKVQGQSIQGDEAVERLVEIRTVSFTNNIESICVSFRISCILKS